MDQLGGPEGVAEMTGRSARIVRRDGALVYEARARGTGLEAVNIRCGGCRCDNGRPAATLVHACVSLSERQHFQAGTKLVAILSDAASTGISLQADRRVANQRAGRSADQAAAWCRAAGHAGHRLLLKLASATAGRQGGACI